MTRRRSSTHDFELYVDGASKGNPGHAGVGVVICREGKPAASLSRYIGTVTNNVAEYMALLYGLQEALIMKAARLVVHTDSELMYRQLTHQYKVRHPAIAVLYQQAVRLCQAFEKVSIRHIPREQNREADRLATQAVREALKQGVKHVRQGLTSDLISDHHRESPQVSFDF